ncbi:hypothetical protein IV203_031463 [Nitzschia inconspicua]|uniref:Uncharacterized protein n=1 Tax=Nitzschia inconspicua TaxID=303405 RepID=A0A9K3LUD3_9STRA|nr:hypothetical protein IV203_031463 [Nitzschia inconspicua]
MTNFRSTTLLLVAVMALLCEVSLSFVPTSNNAASPTQLSMARGRGSFQKEFQDPPRSSSSSSSSGGMVTPTSAGNWLNTKKSVKELPEEDGKVKLLDTGAFLLINKQTNPGGAVSIMKYKGETYCFDANCPKCKIPMTKAYPLPPNEETNNQAPRVACDFCQSTYSLKTGKKLKSQEPKGIFGGIAKAVLGASQDSDPLKTYQLGEKNGKIMFNLDS